MFSISSPTTLETQSYTPPLPPQQVMPITIVKPVSYQFQVVEYTDEKNKVVKVELQVQQTIHDERGNAVRSSGFTAVPRVQLPMVDYK